VIEVSKEHGFWGSCGIFLAMASNTHRKTDADSRIHADRHGVMWQRRNENIDDFHSLLVLTISNREQTKTLVKTLELQNTHKQLVIW